MNVDPSIILQLDQTDHMLNAVVTHYSETTHKGHYITTLFRNEQWIDCNDEVVSATNKVPEMGYLFFYDRVNDVPLALLSLPMGNPEEGMPTERPEFEENYLNQKGQTSDRNNKAKKPKFSSDSTNDFQRKRQKRKHSSAFKDKSGKNDLEEPSSSKFVKLEKEQEKFICKGCDKSYKLIHSHLVKTRYTIKCENALLT